MSSEGTRENSHRARALATTVEQRMRDLGIDQRTLSQRSGVAPSTIRDIRKGAPRDHRPRTLAKLAEALDWPPQALVRVLSAVAEEPAAPAAAYEPPRLLGEDELGRIAALEEELAELRRLVTQRIVQSR